MSEPHSPAPTETRIGPPRFVVSDDTWDEEMEPFRAAMEAACREAGYPNARAELAGSGVFVTGGVPSEVVSKAWEVCRGIR